MCAEEGVPPVPISPRRICDPNAVSWQGRPGAARGDGSGDRGEWGQVVLSAESCTKTPVGTAALQRGTVRRNLGIMPA
jgi:hypothetical protein